MGSNIEAFFVKGGSQNSLRLLFLSQFFSLVDLEPFT
jgi:hypothetical protein